MKGIKMSRSYKKHPYMQCAGNKSYKKIYNRKYRRQHKNDYDLPQNKKYKRENESWEICDILCGWHNIDEYKKFCKHEDLTEEELAEWKRWRSK